MPAVVLRKEGSDESELFAEVTTVGPGAILFGIDDNILAGVLDGSRDDDRGNREGV